MAKRKVSLLLLAAMTGALALAAGCGGDNAGTEAVIATEKAEAPAETEEAEQTLKVPRDEAISLDPPREERAEVKKPESYNAVQEYSSDISVEGGRYISIGADENAVHAFGGAEVRLSDFTAESSSPDSTGGDASSFYGVGAAFLETGGTLMLDRGEISTDSSGGAGVFSYGKNSTAYVRDTKITTARDTSGGVHVAGGGTLFGYDLDIETNGESSAAVRSDRGGGSMVLDGGRYVTNGTGSPAVYCTADIVVNDAEMTANNSEAVCVEGNNSLSLYNVELTGNMPDDPQNDNTWTVIVYQSMSGDAEEGTGTFRMTGGSLASKNGGLLYATNTRCSFYMKGVDIKYSDDSDYFLRVTGNANSRGWGDEEENGADAVFTADAQEIQGRVIWDSISTLSFYMTDHTNMTGSFRKDESFAGEGGNGYCDVYVSDDSVWTVTENCTLTNLYLEGTLQDAAGNPVEVTGIDGTVYVKGSSDVKVTVYSFSQEADLSGASTGGSYEEYADDEV